MPPFSFCPIIFRICVVALIIAFLTILGCGDNSLRREDDRVPTAHPTATIGDVTTEHLMETFSLIANRLEAIERRLEWAEKRLADLEYQTQHSSSTR